MYCQDLLGPPAYEGVSVVGGKAYWGSLYLGDVDPVTNIVYRMFLDRSTGTLIRSMVTMPRPPARSP